MGNTTNEPVPQSGIGYYCAGRRCKIREQCHRHTIGIVQPTATFNDYDMLREPKEPCKFFVDVDIINKKTSASQESKV